MARPQVPSADHSCCSEEPAICLAFWSSSGWQGGLRLLLESRLLFGTWPLSSRGFSASHCLFYCCSFETSGWTLESLESSAFVLLSGIAIVLANDKCALAISLWSCHLSCSHSGNWLFLMMSLAICFSSHQAHEKFQLNQGFRTESPLGSRSPLILWSILDWDSFALPSDFDLHWPVQAQSFPSFLDWLRSVLAS